MYVTNLNNNTVSVIDENTNKVIGQPIDVGYQPFGIVVDTKNNKMYVTNSGNDAVSAINNNNMTDTYLHQKRHTPNKAIVANITEVINNSNITDIKYIPVDNSPYNIACRHY